MRLTLPAPLVNYYRGLSARERVLLLITGGAVLFILNLFVLRFLLTTSRELGSQYAQKSQALRGEKLFADQKDQLWVPREKWLKQTQPVTNNLNVEGSKLQEYVQNLARSNQLILTDPRIQQPRPNPVGEGNEAIAEYQTATVSVKTQSDWQNLVRFLAAVQKPDAFLVFDNASLKTADNDPKRMYGEFTISKWYAPAAK